MPFCCDKIQEASLFFSCKISEATPMLPYLCHPSAVLSSELVHSLFPLYQSKITYISSFTLLHIGSETQGFAVHDIKLTVVNSPSVGTKFQHAEIYS
jgi:hypothetical protein